MADAINGENGEDDKYPFDASNDCSNSGRVGEADDVEGCRRKVHERIEAAHSLEQHQAQDVIAQHRLAD